MQIRPIRTDADHTAAVKRIEALMGAAFGSPEGDELDVLTTLVVEYEKKHYPIPPPEPLAAIEFRMEQQGLTRRDLEPLIGSRARVSEVLNGKRPLTLPMIRRLSSGLNIPVDVLVGGCESETKQIQRSPQERKKLSLLRDRRNVYGENAKSSRKNIPLGKKLGNRAARHAADTPLKSVAGAFEESASDLAEFSAKSGQINRARDRFGKRPDAPLGRVLSRKLGQSGGSPKAFGTPARHLKQI